MPFSFSFSLEPLLTAGLVLASAGQIECSVPKAPEIKIIPDFGAVRYDYSQSEKALTARSRSERPDRVSPYGEGVKTVTHGLREDKPQVRTEVSIGIAEYPDYGIGCFWYDSVTVTIKMFPTIYIAREVGDGVCKDAVLSHEHKHVELDRLVMNKYAHEIGAAVKKAVDGAGAMGPFDMAQQGRIQKGLSGKIRQAVKSRDLALQEEMKELQGKVDSPAEYKRISRICQERR